MENRLAVPGDGCRYGSSHSLGRLAFFRRSYLRNHHTFEMSHRLEPHDDVSYLAPDEIVSRLDGEFAYCAADRDEGDKIVGDTIAKLIELNAPQEIIDQQIAAQSGSIAVVISENMASEDYLQFTVKPNEGILIGYFSWQHEDATRPLLDRCAKALNYRIDLL